MSNKDDFQAKFAEFSAIPDAEIKTPNIPVDRFVQEAENTYQWLQDDKESLTSAGLDWDLVEDIPLRSGALREAESNWFKERFSQEAAQKEWKEKSHLAFDLRDRLLHDLRYAYRKDSNLLNRVAKIDEGFSNADMIQDLNDIAVLGKENIKPLQSFKFDLTKLDQAAVMADEMAELLGKATANQQDNNVARIMRDKAYTYLKQAIDEVRTCGQYVFWRDESRLKGYISQYHKRKRRATSKETTVGEE